MRADLLHVITVLSNPIRWHSRYELFKNFIQHMKDSGVNLTVVECALGERPFFVQPDPDINLVQVRHTSLLWIKECLMNIGISRLPPDWKYLACIDADIFFRHRHWASEAVSYLQQYPVIQPWANCYDLGPNGEHIDHHRSFCRQWWHGHIKGIGPGYTFAHPGYAWCYTRQAVEYLGGLIETAICGAGDHHMALALIGKVDWSVPGNITPGYMKPLIQWQDRALLHLHKNLGFLPGSIEHFWHGRKEARKYISRWDILIRNNFDPTTDLKKNVFGIYELAGNKPQLRHDLDIYFRNRNEDSNSAE